jgi:hypothetical protein
VLRIVSASVLVVLAAAGCGTAAPQHRFAAQGVPRPLAREWAAQASAVASAVGGGNSCRASRIANSLRDEVIAAKLKLPTRLRSPLLKGVDALADRLTCTPPPVTVEPPPSHEHPSHGGGDNGGGGNGDGDNSGGQGGNS